MSGQANWGGAGGDYLELPPDSRPSSPAGFQIALVVLTIAGAGMVATTGELHRWGFIVSLAAQPFWLALTLRARDWGAVLCVLFYTGSWVYGIHNRFSFF